MIKYISPINRKTLNPELVRQIKREFGDLVEPFSLHTPVPELLACTWSALRESLVAGTVDRELKEAVASAVSLSNKCPYCVDAHTLMLHGLARHETAKAIAENRMGDIKDENLKAHIKWAGATNDPDSEVITSPPFSKSDAPEVIAVVFVFQYINRMVSALLGASPLPMGTSPLKGIMKRVGALMFSKALKIDAKRGESLKFVKETTGLPDDMHWAKGNAYVDRAMAAWANAIEENSKELIDDDTRSIIDSYLSNWKGQTPGLDLSWLTEAVKGYDEKTQAMARLSLMAAVAPYRVDEITVQNFQEHFKDDDQLIITLSWASFSAARKIAGWLVPA